jgi:hypothetical protein
MPVASLRSSTFSSASFFGSIDARRPHHVHGGFQLAVGLRILRIAAAVQSDSRAQRCRP